MKRTPCWESRPEVEKYGADGENSPEMAAEPGTVVRKSTFGLETIGSCCAAAVVFPLLRTFNDAWPVFIR